ncbi:MAG: hypothetical protein JOZ69_19140 [Myxococcales bacterium]|nr:hypothetical protein [Myxococcales bacterium]
MVRRGRPEAQAFRARYASSPASDPPKVVQCDTASADTWIAGTALGQRASDWGKLLSDGRVPVARPSRRTAPPSRS